MNTSERIDLFSEFDIRPDRIVIGERNAVALVARGEGFRLVARKSREDIVDLGARPVGAEAVALR